MAIKHLSLTLFLLSLLGSACGRLPEPERKSGGPGAGPEARAQEASRLSALGYAAAPAAKNAVVPPAAPPSPPVSDKNVTSSLKLIWTATLQVEVTDFKKAAEEASRAAASFGGYVSDRQSSDDSEGRNRGTLTLRIPSDRLTGAIGTLKKLGRVRNEGMRTEDVTREYSDLETRLKVKRETAARLREILVRQTGKVSEVLEVEREIARVLEEIERAEGERRYYDNLVALSTVNLSLYEADAMVSPGALDPVFAALRQSVRTASESLAAMVLLVSALLPWTLALYFVFRVARWGWRRRR